MRFSFPHSHAFPGGRVAVDDGDPAEGACVVEFGDGVTVIGAWRPSPEGMRLEVPAYRTGRGTEVAARNWLVAQGKDGNWRSRRGR